MAFSSYSLGFILSLVLVSGAGATASASGGGSIPLKQTYKSLALKDLEDMQKMIFQIKSQKWPIDNPEEVRQIKLEQAFQLIMSRRDSDGARGFLYQSIRGEMAESVVEVVSAVVTESIEGLKDTTISLDERVTHYMILSNILVELHPEASEFQAEFALIRDAKISLTSDVKRSLALNGEKVMSLGDMAAQALKGVKLQDGPTEQLDREITE
jgi:hypothetical protein